VEYHEILNSAHTVLGDGTGVRWAARLRGTRMKDNLVGTDLVPELFRLTAGRGFRYFLLGADRPTVRRAAEFCSRSFPGWELAGYHNGYFGREDAADVINFINSTRPHLLLVAMGNPRQESWIHSHRRQLQVPICVGVGGLFDHWAGNLTRAPLWVRQRGLEWLQILLQQPHKWRRYLIGNPKFLYRVLRQMPRERALTGV
jgi:N-acetylglucosaminyldiphosphoundecaprenol N-acetyl-beta-D-mannosaminyltransferase